MDTIESLMRKMEEDTVLFLARDISEQQGIPLIIN